MLSRTSVKTPKRQKGVALLIMIIVIVLAFSSYFISGLSINQVRIDQAKNAMLTLKKAKQAIINYAVTYADRANGNDYGLLPCPEVIFNGDDGNMTGNCGFKNRNIVGWFPWRSLDLTNLKDYSGTCLFYAVSGTYKVGSSAQADMINEDSVGMLQDVNFGSEIVALVIAPGGPLVGQVRNPIASTSCGRDYANDAAYLEGDGVTDNSSVSAVIDTVDQYIHATETSSDEAPPYNDKFLTITRDEIWNAIVERADFKQKMENLTQALAMCMSNYATANIGNRLPWVAPMGLADYRVNGNYDDGDGTIGYAGRIPFNIDDSNAMIRLAGIDELFTDAICNNLIPTAGVIVDLVTVNSEYRKLWDNWKDHFFYVVSKDYEVDDITAATIAANVAAAAITTASNALAAANIPAADAAVIDADAAATNAVTSAANAVAAANVLSVAAAASAAAAITPAEIAAAAAEVAAASDEVTAAAAITIEVALISTAVVDVTAAVAAVDTVAAAAAVVNADNAVAAAEAIVVAQTGCVLNCITVDPAPLPAAVPTQRAGMVIYAGSRMGAQVRTDPIGPYADTKLLITNYLENGNDAIFPDVADLISIPNDFGGNGSYATSDPDPLISNDIMFCIEIDMSVVECL